MYTKRHAFILQAVLVAALPCFAQEYIISTVAGGGSPENELGDGGPATSARLRSPEGVAVDSIGNLYIADTQHLAIRKVAPDGVISTLVGGPSATGGGFSGDGGPASKARIGGPVAVAVDAGGDVYFADGPRIRKVSTDGMINTVAGGGRCTNSGYGDGGPATHAYLYVAQSVTVDASGNLYIADSSNNQVRKVSPDGVISTVAGIASCRLVETSGFSGDGGPATAAKLLSPRSTAVDAAGNLYIAEWGNSRIRRVDPAGMITTIAGNGELGTVGFRKTLDGVNGAPATSVGIRPQGVVVDAAGNIFIADRANSCVWILTGDGRLHVIAGNNRASGLGDGGPAVKASLNPVALALGKAGTIYVADAFNNRIRLLTPLHPRVEVTGLIPGSSSSARSGSEAFPQNALSAASGTVSVNEIASKMAGAIDSNSKKRANLLYKWQLRTVFTGTAGRRFPVFGGDSGSQVRSEMPVFYGHFQKAGDTPVNVLDGWSDRSPYDEKDLKRRIFKSKQGEPETLDVIQNLLQASHAVTLIGVASQGGRAYVLESLPPQALPPASSGAAARCAASLKATLFIDAETFFPVRMDAEVVRPGMCSKEGSFPLDTVGTREQVHFTKVTRKAACGDIEEIWVMDEGVQSSRNTRDGYIAFPGTIAERKWPLGPEYRVGEFRSITVRSDFQIFVTGACLKFGEVVESKPVESVHSEIRFDLVDPSVPFHEAGTDPAH